MPGCLGWIYNYLKGGSTKSSRNSQRLNGVTEITSNGATAAGAPYLNIPIKTTQFFSSLYVCFSPETKFAEKLVHGLQSGITGAQVGFSIILLFKDMSCSTNTETLCKATFLLDLLWKGLYLLSTAAGELNKEAHPDAADNNPPTISAEAWASLPSASASDLKLLEIDPEETAPAGASRLSAVNN